MRKWSNTMYMPDIGGGRGRGYHSWHVTHSIVAEWHHSFLALHHVITLLWQNWANQCWRNVVILVPDTYPQHEKVIKHHIYAWHEHGYQSWHVYIIIFFTMASFITRSRPCFQPIFMKLDQIMLTKSYDGGLGQHGRVIKHHIYARHGCWCQFRHVCIVIHFSMTFFLTGGESCFLPWFH